MLTSFFLLSVYCLYIIFRLFGGNRMCHVEQEKEAFLLFLILLKRNMGVPLRCSLPWADGEYPYLWAFYAT